MTIELDADVFDTLEFSVLAAGGIGRKRYFVDESDYGVAGELVSAPVCVIGHARFADGAWGEVETFLRNIARLDGMMNDTAVAQINRQKRRPIGTRVSWEEYTKELGIVRKESK